jgi:hypothetical protein
MGMKTNRAAAATTALVLLASTAGPTAASDARPLVLAQAGITIGPRDDLGPRYEPYSESWKTYRPPPPCEWVTVRTRGPDGKVVQQKKWGCRVPARDF